MQGREGASGAGGQPDGQGRPCQGRTGSRKERGWEHLVSNVRRDREEAAAAARLEEESLEIRPEPERAEGRPRVELVQHQEPGL